MDIINGYRHSVAAHCEAGSMRNLLNFNGIDISEDEVFGISSGPQFYFLKFVKTPGGMPLTGIRNKPGNIIKNINKFTEVTVSEKKFRKPENAIAFIDNNLASNIPTAVMVDMFYMNYLPSFLHVHAPFHFIVIIGKENNHYAISDPYSEDVGFLPSEDLSIAMNTHAKMSKDNFCVTVNTDIPEIDFKKAYIRGIISTCKGMFLPPPFIGPSGIRMYADSIRKWTENYSGSHLRDASMLNAVAFEEQGTGGAAFRLMYSSFLEKVGKKLGNMEIAEMSAQFLKHGQFWQDTSRLIISTSRGIPLKDEDFPDWYSKNGASLNDGYNQIADRFVTIADFEHSFFKRLLKIARDLL